MQKWKSHKIVEAGKIASFTKNSNTQKLDFCLVSGEIAAGIPLNLIARNIPSEGDYLVKYDDGYWSWSPAKAFEDGYTPLDDGGRQRVA